MLDDDEVVAGSGVFEIISLVGVTFLNAELALPEAAVDDSAGGLGEVEEIVDVVVVVVISDFSFFAGGG